MAGLEGGIAVGGKVRWRQRGRKAREGDLQAIQAACDARETVGVGVAVEDVAGVEQASN